MNIDTFYHNSKHPHRESDYISPPHKPKDSYLNDYDFEIEPSVSTGPSPKSFRHSRSSFRSSNSFSSSPTHYKVSSPLSPHSYWPGDFGTPNNHPREVSDYQLIKKGGWNHKFDFMRSHGLKTWEDEDHDQARKILDGFRKFDAQNSPLPEVTYQDRADSTMHGANDTKRKTNRWSGESHIEEDLYTNDSDVSSYRSGHGSGIASPISPTACSDNSPHQSSDDEGDYGSYGEDSASDIIRDLSDLDDEDADDQEDGANGSDYADRSDVDSIGSSDVGSMSGAEDGSGDEGSDAGDEDDHVEDGYDGYDEDDEDEA